MNPELHTPIWSCIVVGILAGIPFIQFAGVAIIAIAATGMIYLSYLIGNLALFRARLQGWPKTKAPFALGKWGLPIDDARDRVGRRHVRQHDVAPRRDESAADRDPGHARLPLALAEREPVLWTVLAVILIVGGIYYGLVQRTKPAHTMAPEGETIEAPPVMTT